MYLNIIIPIYNEEATIYKVLENLSKTLEDNYIKNLGYKIKVIILDDNSNDGSRNKIINFIYSRKKKINFHYKKIKKNIGKSKNIFNQIKKINKNELIFILDADLELPASNIKKFLQAIIKTKSDIVCGNRLMKKNFQNLIKYLVFFVGIKFTNFITNLKYENKFKDIHCSQKIFKNQKFPNFYCFKFSIDTELCLFFLKNKKKIYNINLNNYKRRNSKQGKKLGIIQGINLLCQTLLIKVF